MSITKTLVEKQQHSLQVLRNYIADLMQEAVRQPDSKATLAYSNAATFLAATLVIWENIITDETIEPEEAFTELHNKARKFQNSYSYNATEDDFNCSEMLNKHLALIAGICE